MSPDSGNPMLPSRRQFLATSATLAGGLVIACFVPFGTRRLFAQEGGPPPAPPMDPNAFVHIGSDDSVTVVLKHSEMGQGVWTSIPMVVAEELDCDWSKVRVENAPNAQVYANNAFGIQGTGGSTSTLESFGQMREAGAMARAMLVDAAAQRWKVDPSTCRTEKGRVISGTHSARYGELADAAAKLKAPEKVALKDPSKWTLIGKPTPRLDSLAKVTGTAGFGIDVQRPGLLVAMVARAPVFGGTVKSFDATKARAVDGVVDVLQVPSGVAVLGKHTWAAKKGRDALVIDWDNGAGATMSTEAMRADYRKRAGTRGLVAKTQGEVDAALEAAEKRIEADYEVPFLAHAPMEPLNCTVEIGKDGCEIWTGTQFQGVDQGVVAQILGIEPGRVKIHTQFLGGGFGRRANPVSDFVAEAVQVAKAANKPVKLVWTREDDVRGGYYRPMWLSRFSAALGKDGKPSAWSHTIVGQSIIAGTPFAPVMIKDGIDATSVEGAADSPYLAAIPAHRVDLHTPTSPIPVLWWRSVGHSHTGFVVESFIDELAHAARTDPLEFRRKLLPADSRNLRALELAAREFGWGKPLPKGHAAGLAVHESFASHVAQVAEVSVEDGKIRVHRVVCAVDCGPVVNPMTIEAQMQSAIAFGLGAALHSKITFKDGKVEQGNFNDYLVLRLDEMPKVEVHIVKSTDKMGGVGEPGLPPIAPAVANAVFAATGKRLRSLPFVLT
ncbi:xanthine dehydrogenase family protein molybdopterin-binding subunit [Dokdonella immobilis]|uniref:Isoquinoline 1-oxidoreductase, beta subunit n=1 Tax=Dokdonella immobilis TaxID=578942 RepID=A0A1I4X322_9GAMM|nr:xanthine dehydrogenase family protein molybdopterin-binding subunit [Dokdonella immobilis]SFN19760.1 isoquinoline 1-oxidoreductase, beta subunit [Dokdonella immobilis]